MRQFPVDTLVGDVEEMPIGMGLLSLQTVVMGTTSALLRILGASEAMQAMFELEEGFPLSRIGEIAVMSANWSEGICLSLEAQIFASPFRSDPKEHW